ncbi:hypothetical protein [Streptacidiphilus rugosus]|uniref:hypothetical protein n=1 Tax=Streptacidiphilus rugosus TaxID=405783 RepID=UPI00055BCD1D|nr:hypothetical protein [Streptacidiphilus rugosus]
MNRSDGIRASRRGRRLGRSASTALAATGGLLAAATALAPAAHAGLDAPMSTQFDQHCVTLNGVPTDEITVNVENLGPQSGITSNGVVVAYTTATPGNVVDHTASSGAAFDPTRNNTTFTFAVPNPSAADTLTVRVTGFWNSPTEPSATDSFSAPVVNCATAGSPGSAVFAASSWPFSSASATATCGVRFIRIFNGGWIRIPWETIAVHVGPDFKNTTGSALAGMPVWADYWTDGGSTGYTQGATSTFDSNGNATLTFTVTPTAGTELNLMVSSRSNGVWGNRTFPQHLWAPACG